ncbi:MAG: DUF2946 family protein [Bacteroidales bacterium]
MLRARATYQAKTAARARGRRLAAWLGAIALVLQMLVPLAQPQAAWVQDGLFPPTCSAHHDFGADAGDRSDDGACQKCTLCRGLSGDRIGMVPDRAVPVVFAAAVMPAVIVPVEAAAPDGVRSRPPLPSRGPPRAL